MSPQQCHTGHSFTYYRGASKKPKLVTIQLASKEITREEAQKLIRESSIKVYCGGIYRNEGTFDTIRESLGVETKDFPIGVHRQFKENDWTTALYITDVQGSNKGPLITRLRYVFYDKSSLPRKTLRELARM